MHGVLVSGIRAGDGNCRVLYCHSTSHRYRLTIRGLTLKWLHCLLLLPLSFFHISTTMSVQVKDIDKTATARDWVKTSLKALKEIAPLVKHVPWLGVAAGTVVQALELWDVSCLFHFFIPLFSFMVSLIMIESRHQ